MHQIGVDMETVGRFGLNQTTHSIFLDKVYTKDELEYCFSKDNPESHLAARFAAKEALVKALSNFGYDQIDYSQIEIQSKESIPSVRFHDKRFKKINASISLSHTKKHAIAMCICEQ